MKRRSMHCRIMHPACRYLQEGKGLASLSTIHGDGSAVRLYIKSGSDISLGRYHPNYTDPETKGNQLLVVTIISTILAIASVLARVWVRIGYQQQFGADDVMLVLCIVPTVGIAGLLILTETKFRWFRHIWDVPLDEITGRQYHNWIVQLLFVISTTFSKLSAVLLYKRVIAGVSRPAFLYIINAAIAAQTLYGVAFVLLLVLQCRPISSYWLQFSYPDPYTEKFSCLYERSAPFSNACISMVTDFFAAMLPMFLFLQLQMPKRDKYGLGAIFGVGFIVCICGIIRSVLVYHIFYQSFDVTWLSHDLGPGHTLRPTFLLSAVPYHL
ncbi:hypothetical protein GMDG_00028 [Pseudogymnoascus destructans 20631-21]|uniref:Rhodopsin domain-containing protein n=1 Tax=Pseudogymnoascus destructans (strain ATCC MYA-4855 / 20631-21) TaxID=658429 RepID=L8FL56_PSED2|nr:hypothetical protein GMDG_00028 [Pseudogymnoascus destructans 20631-21]